MAISSSFYQYLLLEEYTYTNPVALIQQKSKFVQKRQGHTKVRRLSQQQWQTVIDTAEQMADVVIAYEPIWAIGTGTVPTVDEIKEVVSSIKGICDENFAENVKNYTILYGGSVGVKNAGEILGVDELDGLLVGKVSLEANDFFEICEKASLSS